LDVHPLKMSLFKIAIHDSFSLKDEALNEKGSIIL
jgi:hypothetical protein